MATGTWDERDDEEVVERIAELALRAGRTIAVAESLTAGHVSARLGAGTDAATWFKGAVVAYDEGVKFKVLGVTPGPVVTDSCAREMAEGVRRLLGADLAIGITGVGGPGPEEGRPAGTVHLAEAGPDGTRSHEHHVPGDPDEVIARVTRLVLDRLLHALS